MLMEHFNLHDEANCIRKAVETSLSINVCTPDINTDNHFSTERVGDFLESVISDADESNINDENLNFGQMTII